MTDGVLRSDERRTLGSAGRAMVEEGFRAGETVRVKSSCPHTLPAYARMMTGIVEGTSDDGLVTVRFGEERVFPIAPECLKRVPPPGEMAD